MKATTGRTRTGQHVSTGRYRRVLVVNGEFNTLEGGPLYPANFRLETARPARTWSTPGGRRRARRRASRPPARGTHSRSTWVAGMADKLCCVYRELGSVVSASIPAAMAMAIDAGRVRRGDRLVGWVGSAGMSFAAYSFPY